MARDRRDEFTDEPDDRPRRRDDDDEPDDRPRRRRRRDDDYDDVPDIRKRELSGFDGMFANTSMVALILFGLCCGDIALILGIIGLIICKDDTAKQNALIVTVISAVRVVAVVGYIIFSQVALKG
jgi:hypothetical protein